MIPVQPHAEPRRLWLSRRAPVSRFAFAFCAALALAGGLDWFLLNGPAYKAHAIAGLSAKRHGTGDLDQAAILATARPVFLRAAETLRDQGLAVSSPDQSLDAEADSLAAGTVATPDIAARAIVIEAGGATGARAAAAANAVAKAFVEIENGAASDYERRQQSDGGETFQKLSDVAAAAHQRLDAALANADPARQRAKAAALTLRAKTHYEAFVAMLASGAPPVGAQTGLPPSIAPLQANYLELKRQLVLAQRSMGPKYPGAATLENAMRLAAKKLQAEWERLTQAAKANWERTRDAGPPLAASSAVVGPEALHELDEARLAANAADDALARSQTGISAQGHLDPPYKLIAGAAIPHAAAGLPATTRHLLAALSGLVLAYALLKSSAPPARSAAPRAGPDMFDPEPVAMDGQPARILLDRLANVAPQPGYPLTVFVGTLEDPASTATAALAVARAAAWSGYRVLLIEAQRARSRLAGAVATDAEPVVVDILGTLKAALPDQRVEGLYVAPAVPGAAHLAADLVNDGDVCFISEAGEAFDLAIVDAGRVGTGVWDDCGEAADATIRVGRSRRESDDRAFLAAAAASPRCFLGVIDPAPGNLDDASVAARHDARRWQPHALVNETESV